MSSTGTWYSEYLVQYLYCVVCHTARKRCLVLSVIRVAGISDIAGISDTTIGNSN